MKVFKKKVWWIPFIYIISLICLIILIKIFLPSNYFDISIYLYRFIGLQVLIILFISWARYKSQFIIKEDRIIAKGLFKNKEVRLNEIIGFKKEYWESVASSPIRYIALKTKNEVYKSIKIHSSYINFIELQQWIESSFTDLDRLEEKKDWNSVLSSKKIGSNVVNRTLFVKKAKRVANILNFSAILLFVFLFFPSTYSYILIPVLIIPLASICAVFYFKGIIRLENFSKYKFKNNKPEAITDDSSVFTDVFLAITLPTLTIFTIITSTYTILSYYDLWKTALIISTIILLLSLMTTKEFVFNKIKSYIKIAMVFVFLFGYIFFGITGINCAFDNSVPIKDTGIIINKSSRLVSGRSIIKTYEYTFVVKSFKLEKLEKIKVDKEVYEKLETGGNFTFIIREGLFSIKWIPITKVQ